MGSTDGLFSVHRLAVDGGPDRIRGGLFKSPPEQTFWRTESANLTTYKARSYIYIFIFVPVWQKNNMSLTSVSQVNYLSKPCPTQFKFY